MYRSADMEMAGNFPFYVSVIWPGGVGLALWKVNRGLHCSPKLLTVSSFQT
jgi:hypothetical protein